MSLSSYTIDTPVFKYVGESEKLVKLLFDEVRYSCVTLQLHY